MSAPRSGRERGSVIVIVALLLPVLILMTAFAVDLGRERSLRRQAQADADVIALDLVRLADGRNLQSILDGTASPLLDDSGQPLDEPTAIAESSARNDVLLSNIAVEWGTFSTGGGFVSLMAVDPAVAIPSAVRVTTVDSIDYFFQPGDGDVERIAIASTEIEPLAAFTIGSFGLGLDPTSSGVLHAIVTPILGNPAGFNALSYQGLANASFRLDEVAAELGLLTTDQVFTEEVTYQEAMVAAATVMQRNGDTASAQLYQDAAGGPIGGQQFNFGQIVNADTTGQDEALATQIDAAGFLQSAAFLSQCAPGATTFADCTALSLPQLTTTFPATQTSSQLKIIESPRYHRGPIGTGTTTNQSSLATAIDVGAQTLGPCTPTGPLDLSCLLGNAVSGSLIQVVEAEVEIDATITLAGGQATIDDIDCADPAALVLDLETSTSAYTVDTDIRIDFRNVSPLGAPLGQLGSLTLNVATNQAASPELVTFTVAPDIYGQTVRSTGSGDVGLGTAGYTVTSSTGYLGFLNNIAAGSINGVLTSIVNPVLVDLNTTVLAPLTNSLGLNVVGADLTAEDRIECRETKVRLVG